MVVAESGVHDAPVERRDAGEADPHGPESKHLAIVHALVVMPVESDSHPQLVPQRIDSFEAMRMSARGFVGHEDVGAVARQRLDVLWKNRRSVLARQSTAPAILPWSRRDERLLVACSWGPWRHPHLAAKYPTEPSDSHTGNGLDSAVEIAVGKRGVE